MLHKIIHRNDLSSLRSALASGQSPDQRDESNRTALMNACIDGKQEAANILLEAGADPNIKDHDGNSALHFAAHIGNASIIIMLLAKNALVDIQDAKGNTPLWRAVFNCRGDGTVISLLLGAGADRNHINRHGRTPLQLAQSIANFDVKQHLL
jgi:uncharacterized protein